MSKDMGAGVRMGMDMRMGTGMNLARVSQAALGKVVHESGLGVTADQVRDIVEVESACLSECRRVSFGESAAVRVVRELAGSSYLLGDEPAKILADLVEAFYELRESFPASITDLEIIESLKESFDGDAAGEAELAVSLAGEALAKRLDYSTYEIADADGNVYRWDPKEWHDDVMSDGWYGERWEDVDE